MHVAPANLDAPDVQDLLRLHLDQMHDASPPESVHALDLDSLRQPDITVWVAIDQGRAVGIGALRAEKDAVEGEVKSMRTDPRHVGQGIGRMILATIIAEARGRGLVRLCLETGTGESFRAAHHLYLSEGFVPCGPFGAYTDDPYSRYFLLDL